MRTTAPPQLYERPHVQLLRLLADAKARGLSFGEAWSEAMLPGKAIVMSNTVAAPATAIRWPTDRFDREAWRNAIMGSREAWRRAYYNDPPRSSEQALVVLGDMLGSLDGALPLDGMTGDRALVFAA